LRDVVETVVETINKIKYQQHKDRRKNKSEVERERERGGKNGEHSHSFILFDTGHTIQGGNGRIFHSYLLLSISSKRRACPRIELN